VKTITQNFPILKVLNIDVRCFPASGSWDRPVGGAWECLQVDNAASWTKYLNCY